MKSEVGSAVVSLKKDDRVSELRSPASIAAPHPARRAFVDPSGKNWLGTARLARCDDTGHGGVHIGDSGLERLGKTGCTTVNSDVIAVKAH